MNYEILTAFYYQFYTPQDHTAEKAESDVCHAELSKTLDISERKLLLQLLDAENCIQDAQTLECFIAGFRLAWMLSAELNYDINECLESDPRRSEEGTRS